MQQLRGLADRNGHIRKEVGEEKVSVGGVNKPKVYVASVNSPKRCSFAVIC